MNTPSAALSSSETCAACPRSIAERVQRWKANGGKGRKPKYCENAECKRVRTAARARLARKNHTPVHARQSYGIEDALGLTEQESEAAGIVAQDPKALTPPPPRHGDGNVLPPEIGNRPNGWGQSGTLWRDAPPPHAVRTPSGRVASWVKERWPAAAAALERGEKLPAEIAFEEWMENHPGPPQTLAKGTIVRVKQTPDGCKVIVDRNASPDSLRAAYERWERRLKGDP